MRAGPGGFTLIGPELAIDPERLSPGETPPDLPLGFIDLDRTTAADRLVLPPYPVIGIGRASHPLGAQLDAVIEPPVSAGRIVAQVLGNPLAAAAVTRLLRVLPSLDLSAGLVVESATYAMLQGSAEHARWLATHADGRRKDEPAGAVVLVREDATLHVVLNRPQARNAIDARLRDALAEALTLATLDPEIERVILRAAGRVFSLGADLTEFGTTTDPATAHAIRARTLPAHQAIGCAHKLEVQVDGACIGAGLELAAFARHITATPRAWFQLPELAMGILPGAGGCASLTRRIGRQRTLLMILSGQRLSARQARDWGLVDTLVDELA